MLWPSKTSDGSAMSNQLIRIYVVFSSPGDTDRRGGSLREMWNSFQDLFSSESYYKVRRGVRQVILDYNR